ncbi:MAG TPA: hypothetical protein DCZ95_17935 [Verrucomicrobia bacterium]|nr:MAG: hypothetical protein A2X46_10710 [Lentisphaerae bacterium GWF2_57_35]HBA85968.1 hypothetical protein [Verrucomicrobiota bacterium]
MTVEGLAETLTIATPRGPVEIDIAHAGPSGDLVAPVFFGADSFLPPTIFSAPLPSGSGARALGMAGAFTALADDATAASWNPGGLTQLESKEVSYVLRLKTERQTHESESGSFRVGEDRFDRFQLNYLSLAYPVQGRTRNWIYSVNYQEVYDFNQRFTADLSQSSSRSVSQSKANTFHETVIERYRSDHVDMTLKEHLNTTVQSSLQQLLQQDLVSSLDFDQEGIVDAISPAMAVDLTRQLSLGATVNFYKDGYLFDRGISSETKARYSGYSGTINDVRTLRTTSGSYEYTGVAHFEPNGSNPDPFDFDFSGDGAIEPFSETTHTSSRTQYKVDGAYEEHNDINDLFGWNATLGVLWAPCTFLNLGFTVDLPWTADASMTKTIKSESTTYNADGSRVLDRQSTEERITKDVKFDFPLYWSAGSAVKWNNQSYTLLDVSQTLWSDFLFQADGSPAVNPLDGSLHGEHPLDDCWSIRLGHEYLLLFSRTEIPLRAGLGWEQRPAIDRPDEYWSISLGSGISIGNGAFKSMLDVAYEYKWADNVMGSLVPGQSGLDTDVEIHQVFVSNIWHF